MYKIFVMIHAHAPKGVFTFFYCLPFDMRKLATGFWFNFIINSLLKKIYIWKFFYILIELNLFLYALHIYETHWRAVHLEFVTVSIFGHLLLFCFVSPSMLAYLCDGTLATG